MPATYEPIATTTLGSAQSSITFSGIPNTYTDLRVVLSALGTTSDAVHLRFNSNSALNYSKTQLRGDGASATSTQDTNSGQMYLSNALSSSNPALITIDVFSYAGSTNKTLLATTSQDKNGSGSVIRICGLWRQTSAIDTITLTADAVNFTAGTTATLYGITKF